jgi:nitronate monooxygenase
MKRHNEVMPDLNIGNLKLKKPIIQGGMGVGISLSGLASAVANEGGIGVISSVALGLLADNPKTSFKEGNQQILKREIRKARTLTDGVLGLNIMVAISDYDQLVKLAFDEEIDIIFLGAGLPLKFPETITEDRLKKGTTKVGVIVSSGRAVKLIFQTWQKKFDHVPDLVVVEGPKAGGHLGFKKEQILDPAYALENLLPDVLSVVKSFERQFDKKIPVIVAGGIYNGADIFKFIEMGAGGVQMGTRFVATHECDASLEFKKAYINCKEDDLVIIESPVGLPGRAIRNKFLDEVSTGDRKPFQCPWKCLKTCNFREAPYCIAKALANAQKGNVEEGYTFAGANAFRVREIVSVKELFKSLEQEYNNAVVEFINQQQVINEKIAVKLFPARLSHKYT